MGQEKVTAEKEDKETDVKKKRVESGGDGWHDDDDDNNTVYFPCGKCVSYWKVTAYPDVTWRYTKFMRMRICQ